MRYEYQPLASAQHIRLLVLAPAKHVDARLECLFEKRHIESQSERYQAISYTWGNQKLDQDLHCEGAIIKITMNLSSALRRFRSKFKPRKLWADAVCINQNDNEEKSSQIPLMFEIYRFAEKVLIWLGEGEVCHNKAIDVLELVARSARPSAASSDPEELEKMPGLCDVRKLVRAFFQIPWFSRRWVVQELVLNKNAVFHYGRSKIPWPTIHMACEALDLDFWKDDSTAQVRRQLRRFGNLWHAWCYSNRVTTQCDLISLLHSFHDLQCGVAKDRLYALAGLATDVHMSAAPPSTRAESRLPVIVPDYKITDGEVFRNLALAFIQSGNIFRTLALAAAYQPSKGEKGLRSWVPDFRCRPRWEAVPYQDNVDFIMSEKPQWSYGKLKLNIKSYSWAYEQVKFPVSANPSPMLKTPRPIRVQEVYIPPEEDKVETTIQKLNEWNLKAMSRGQFSVTSQVLSDAPNFILGSLAADDKMMEEDAGIRDHYDEFRLWFSGKMPKNDPSGEQWERHLHNAVSTHRFFASECVHRSDGYVCMMGAGPTTLREGDSIFRPTSEKASNASSLKIKYSTSKVLFLRREEDGYAVVGDGYAAYTLAQFHWQVNPILAENLHGEEIEINLV